jgi:TatD DNase family protein
MIGPFDTHSHIQDPRLVDGFGGVLERALAANMAGIAICGYDAPSNELALDLASRSPLLHPTVGFHPHEADQVTPAMLEELESLAALPEVIAVGEIGLDSYRHHSSPENQRSLLDAQLEIALRVGKPVCVHTRAAESAAIDHLGAYAARARSAGLAHPGVMHCFGGTLEQARPYVEAGFFVSVACTVTYPKNDEAARVVRGLPLEALVIETDSPYLPPQGRRGQLNEPSYVIEAAKSIASLRSDSLAHVLETTTRNAAQLFRVQVPEPVVTR